MRAVLASIKPRYCSLIEARDKGLEVRKTVPNLPTPFKVYIYETKGKIDEPWIDEDGHHIYTGRGQVVGEFICDYISAIALTFDGLADVVDCEMSCLTPRELFKYADGKPIYGWHISDPVFYEKPKDLSEFYKAGTLSNADFEYQLYDGSGDPRRRSYASYLFTQAIRRPPQSWCYVEVVDA